MVTLKPVEWDEPGCPNPVEESWWVPDDGELLAGYPAEPTAELDGVPKPGEPLVPNPDELDGAPNPGELDGVPNPGELDGPNPDEPVCDEPKPGTFGCDDPNPDDPGWANPGALGWDGPNPCEPGCAPNPGADGAGDCDEPNPPSKLFGGPCPPKPAFELSDCWPVFE